MTTFLKRLGRQSMFKRLSFKELTQIHYQSHHPITTLIAQRINSEITALRKEKQFDHIIEQKRDWMSYLVLQIVFRKNTTLVILRAYDRVLFSISTGNYCRFKRKAGLLPWEIGRSRRLHKANAPEMMDWIIRFFNTQNIKYVHLQVSGWHTIRHEVLRKVFDGLTVIQFADTTKLSFSNTGLRRRGRPHIKARYRPRGTIRIGKSRLTQPKEDQLDYLEEFGQ